jgi:hypothetical protein
MKKPKLKLPVFSNEDKKRLSQYLKSKGMLYSKRPGRAANREMSL